MTLHCKSVAIYVLGSFLIGGVAFAALPAFRNVIIVDCRMDEALLDMSIREIFDHHSAIFIGEVTEVGIPPSERATTAVNECRSKLKPKKIFKAQTPQSEYSAIFYTDPTKDMGLKDQVTPHCSISKGEEYLIFVRKDAVDKGTEEHPIYLHPGCSVFTQIKEENFITILLDRLAWEQQK